MNEENPKTGSNEEDIFIPDLVIDREAEKKFREDLRIQFVVSRWEAVLLRYVINRFIAMHKARQHSLTLGAILLSFSAIQWFLLSMYIALFHSRAQHVHNFYMSNYTKINGLEESVYSKNKRCKVVTIYAEPSAL